MTQPPNPYYGQPGANDPYQAPNYDQPTQFAPQPDGGYGQPQYGQPQYGQPQYGQPQYGQPQYGQPQYGQSGLGGPGFGPAARPPKSNTGKFVALGGGALAIILAVVLVIVFTSGGGDKKNNVGSGPAPTTAATTANGPFAGASTVPSTPTTDGTTDSSSDPTPTTGGGGAAGEALTCPQIADLELWGGLLDGIRTGGSVPSGVPVPDGTPGAVCNGTFNDSSHDPLVATSYAGGSQTAYGAMLTAAGWDPDAHTGFTVYNLDSSNYQVVVTSDSGSLVVVYDDVS
jgi:hypothetical protein